MGVRPASTVAPTHDPQANKSYFYRAGQPEGRGIEGAPPWDREL
jgi:hypothetical protein